MQDIEIPRLMKDATVVITPKSIDFTKLLVSHTMHHSAVQESAMDYSS